MWRCTGQILWGGDSTSRSALKSRRDGGVKSRRHLLSVSCQATGVLIEKPGWLLLSWWEMALKLLLSQLHLPPCELPSLVRVCFVLSRPLAFLKVSSITGRGITCSIPQGTELLSQKYSAHKQPMFAWVSQSLEVPRMSSFCLRGRVNNLPLAQSETRKVHFLMGELAERAADLCRLCCGSRWLFAMGISVREASWGKAQEMFPMAIFWGAWRQHANNPVRQVPKGQCWHWGYPSVPDIKISLLNPISLPPR